MDCVDPGVSKVQKVWDDLADLDAAWFNVPDDTLPHRRWDIDEFFASGHSHLRATLRKIDQLGLKLERGKALDFGCGLGRVTQAMAEHFQLCYGVDISEKMIAMAQRHNRFPDRCLYVVNPSVDLACFNDKMFDFVFSTNALQHNDPVAIRGYLKEFARLLKCGGVFVIQLPTDLLTPSESSGDVKRLPRYHPTRVFNKVVGITIGHETRFERLRRLGIPSRWLYRWFSLHPHIQMQLIQENSVLDLLRENSCEVKHTERYSYKGMVHVDIFGCKAPRPLASEVGPHRGYA